MKSKGYSSVRNFNLTVVSVYQLVYTLLYVPKSHFVIVTYTFTFTTHTDMVSSVNEIYQWWREGVVSWQSQNTSQLKPSSYLFLNIIGFSCFELCNLEIMKRNVKSTVSRLPFGIERKRHIPNTFYRGKIN